MSAKNKNMQFTVNVDFATKVSKELTGYVEQLNTLKKNLDTPLTSNFVDDINKELKNGIKLIDNFSKQVNNPGLKKNEKLKLVDTNADELQGLINNMKSLGSVRFTNLIKDNDKLLKQLDDLKDRSKKISSAKGNITKNSNKKQDAQNQLASMGFAGNAEAPAASISNLKTAIKKNNTLIEQNKLEGKATKELEEQNANYEKQIELLGIIAKANTNIANARKKVSEASAIDGKAGTTDPDKAGARVGKAAADTEGKVIDPELIDEVTNKFVHLENQAKDTGDSIVTNFRNGKYEILESAEAAQEAAETVQSLKQVLAQFGIVISAVGVVNYFKQMASAAFDFYKSLDSALNQIYIVSNLTSEAVMNLKDSFIEMSKDSGMAIDDIAQSAVLFYQQGLNTDEVMEMTEVTAQFAKVAGIDATDAADKLTAAVNGYCLSAGDAATVADKFNKVAAASAADINELSTAFEKAAAQANQAGIGMDNYLAYIATMEEATREAPENIGTSLKTIMSRFQEIKEAGTTEDGETSVNNAEAALKSVGVALRDADNQLRDLEDVLGDLGPKWDQLDRNTQAYLGTVLAGTRQQSRFITLMQNWDRVLELSEISEDSAGMQALMHQKAMESLETATQRMTNAWQTFLSNLTDSSTFKNLINLVTALLDRINKGNAPVVVLGAAIGALSKHLAKLGGPLVSGIKNLGKFVKSVKDLGKSGKIGNKSIAEISKAMEDNTEAMQANEENIVKYSQALDDLTTKGQETTVVTDAFGNATTYTADDVDLLKSKIELEKMSLDGHKTALEQNTEAMNQFKQQLSTAATAGSGLLTLVTILVGAFDGLNSTTGGTIVGIAGIAGAIITLIPVINAVKTAGITSIKALDAAF